MGLLDMFNGAGEKLNGLLGALDQPGANRALMAAANAMLEASGPSRVPVTTMQALSRGMLAGHDAMDEHRRRQFQEEQWALKKREAEVGIERNQLENKKDAFTLAQRERIRNRFRGLEPSPSALSGGGFQMPETGGVPDAGQSFSEGSDPYNSMPYAGENNPAYQATGGAQGVPMEAFDGGLPMNVQGTARTGSAFGMSSETPGQKPNQTAAMVSRFIQQAQILAEEDDIDGANKLLSQASKFIPNVHQIKVGMKDGKPVNVVYFNDGTKEISEYAPPPEYHFADLNDRVQPIDQYTGQAAGPGFKKGMSQSDVVAARREANKVEPTQVENLATMIAEGRMGPLGAQAMRTPFGQAVMSRVAEKNPNYRAQDFRTFSQAEKDFASGKQGNTIRSFNVGLAHLDSLGQLVNALEGNDIQQVNRIANAYAAQTGKAAPTNFNAAKKIVGDEIVKAIVGASGALADREEIAKTIDAANSPEQLAGVIGTFQELMVGQLGGLEQQYKASTGRTGDDFTRFLSPEAKKLYSKHGKGTHASAPGGAGNVVGSGSFSVVAPNGKTYAFATAKQLANFKLSAGIK